MNWFLQWSTEQLNSKNMRSETTKRILSETPQEVKDAVRAYSDLKVENERLKLEIREFKLLVREYFKELSLLRNHPTIAVQIEAKGKATYLEKRILSELERFTEQEQEELPFKEKEI